MALATAIATSLLSLVFKGFLPPTPAPSCASFPPRQAMGLGQCKANEKLPGSMVIPGGIFNTFGKHSSASSGQGWHLAFKFWKSDMVSASQGSQPSVLEARCKP